MRSLLFASLLVGGAADENHSERTDKSLSEAFSEGIKQQTLEKLRTQGESITIMVCGESGLGKTSLLSSLFHTELVWPATTKGQASAKIAEQMVTFDLEGMPFSARLIDTPGFWDVKRMSSDMIVKRLNAGFDRMLAHERRIKRGSLRGSEQSSHCVDVALYFFAPHRCKRVDIQFLKRLQNKVSIVPVLAKADSMTADEVRAQPRPHRGTCTPCVPVEPCFHPCALTFAPPTRPSISSLPSGSKWLQRSRRRAYRRACHRYR